MFRRLKRAFPTLLISVAISLVMNQMVQAQGVGIGTVNPDKSAILDLSSSDRGLLLPRMSLKNRTNIADPAKGLMIYQTDYMSGIYVYNGTKWSALGTTEAKLTTADNAVWGTSGNTGLSETDNFIGTLDEVPLIFKVNDRFSGKIDPSRGNLFLGYRSAASSQAYNSVALGALSMQKVNTSGNNISIGFQSMFSNETGGHNVSIGTGALAANIHGGSNVAIGSLSGYKSTGSGNVFLGFQAGYAEQGNNKFILNNDSNRSPLIYGDFETGRLGINTTDLSQVLNIKSNQSNNSGLRFLNLTNESPALNSNGKVLSLNEKGEVILVNDQAGLSTASNWELVGNDIINKNSGVTSIRSGLRLMAYQNMSNKFLGLDNSGNVVPVDAPVVASSGANSGYWFTNSWGALNPVNNLPVHFADINANRINLGGGGVYFLNLNSKTPNLSASNGLGLSLDENGRIILTRLPTGGTGGSSSVWNLGGSVISTPGDNKVVIGTGMNSLPDGYSLYVKKGILAERVRVAVANSAKWADYVFEDNYKLMPLKEVAEYIDENDHLPNVPSAADIANSGIDMAEMSAKHMEKIEELTLYAIDANNKIEQMQKEIDELKEMVLQLSKN